MDIDPPAEPRILAADQYLGPFTNGAVLSLIPSAWMALLEPFPWGDDVANGLRDRGEQLFWVGARILGCEDEGDAAVAAGQFWSLADGAFHCSDDRSREFLLGEARAAITKLPNKMPRALRPLTVLAALAAADVLHGGRGRGRAALVHRLMGRFPQP